MIPHRMNLVNHGRIGAVLSLLFMLTACARDSTAPPIASPSPVGAPTASGPPAASPSATTGTPRPTQTPAFTRAPTEVHVNSTPKSAVSPALDSIYMQDANIGWGLSQNGVFHTKDGGRHWTDVTPQEGWEAKSIVKGFFLDPESGWVMQPLGDNSGQGTLYHTRDGGRSWEAVSVPFGPNPLQFLSSMDGWVMADRGAAAGSQAMDVYKTTDGGATWQKVASAGPNPQAAGGGIPFGGDKIGMAFKDMREGWIGGTQPIVGHSYLYRTTDGGKTWRSQHLSIPAHYASSGVLVFAPRFYTAQDGVLPVLLQTQVRNLDFYVTRDGGETWDSTTVVPNGAVYHVTTGGEIWAWAGSSLQISQDNGRTWTSVAPDIPFQGDVKQIDFLDAERGWAISIDSDENRYLYSTANGGHTWNQLSN
jgi:photosystem II stability/assembly factor-like uncharacterized protein